VQRRIVGFHQDEAGDWVAGLSCLHRQHVRHRPPFQNRPWALDEDERSRRVGTVLDCPLCDRAEMPAGLEVVRTAGPFDNESLPPGLRGAHSVADGRWALLRAVRGSVDLALEVSPPSHRHLDAGDQQPIPPGVPHRVTLSDAGVIEIDFLVAR
jgi:hypothetical protein